MQWVDIRQFDGHTRQAKVRVRFILEDGKIRWEGDKNIAETIVGTGVFSVSAGRTVTPSDGEAFLTGLGEEYRSAYISASDINEGSSPPRLQ